MTSDRNRTADPLDERVAFELALEQSRKVQEKVEAAADDLGSTNYSVKKKVADGATTLRAHKVLEDGERVEDKVQECADNLHEVNDSLAEGIADLKQVEISLIKSKKSLADAETALATAREDEQKASLRALHDSTTGLPNRDLFDDRLAHAIALAERHDWTLAVMFLDLDRFKSINDTHGHAAGDRVLKEIAERLLQHSRDEDTVCRNGGDEFLYLLMNPQGSENIERIAGDIFNNIAQPIDLGDLQLVIKSSIGIAVYPDHGTTGERLINNADTAMYRAKKRTSSCVFFNALETEKTDA